MAAGAPASNMWKGCLQYLLLTGRAYSNTKKLVMGADRRRLGALQVLAGAAAIALLVALASGQLGHLPNRETSVLARGEHVVSSRGPGAD